MRGGPKRIFLSSGLRIFNRSLALLSAGLCPTSPALECGSFAPALRCQPLSINIRAHSKIASPQLVTGSYKAALR